jgi:hypothetical protein
MRKKPTGPKYHSAEVYDHQKPKKRRKSHHKYPQGEIIPVQLYYLAVALAVLMTVFLGILVVRG